MLPMWIMRDTFLLRRTEAEAVQTNTSMPLWALLLTGCFPVVIVLGIVGGVIGAYLGKAIFEEAFCKGGHCLMEPELLLSVDSERRFWLDPRTKLYMLVIFSIVMIDGKTDRY